MLSPGQIYGGFSGFSCYYRDTCGDNSVETNPAWYFYKFFGYKNIDLYQTLPIIAVAQLIALPAMGRSFSVRFVYCIALLIFYGYCHSLFWFEQIWVSHIHKTILTQYYYYHNFLLTHLSLLLVTHSLTTYHLTTLTGACQRWKFWYIWSSCDFFVWFIFI